MFTKETTRPTKKEDLKKSLLEYIEFEEKYEALYGEDTVILYKCGDFYEIYELPFLKISKLSKISEITGLVKTSKKRDKPPSESNHPMMGFQPHSFDRFVSMLMNSNYTCVVVEQIALLPKVERAVSLIYSPGTYIHPLQVESTNIACVYLPLFQKSNIKIPQSIGLSVIDVYTGECFVYETCCTKEDLHIAYDEARNFISSYNIKEIIIVSDSEDDTNTTNIITNNISITNNTTTLNKNIKNIISELGISSKKIHIKSLNKTIKSISYQNEFFKKVYKCETILSPIEYIGLEFCPDARISLITLLNFIKDYNKLFSKNINIPELFLNNKRLTLFNDAIKQLNIVPNENFQSDNKIKCLFDIIDKCETFMGKRYLRKIVCNPSCDIIELNHRYKLTEDILSTKGLQEEIDKYLKSLCDVQRLCRKITYHMISPHDLYIFIESIISINIFIKSLRYKNIESITKIIPDVDTTNRIIDFTDMCKEVFDFTQLRKYVNISHIVTSLFLEGINKDIDNMGEKMEDISANVDDLAKVLVEIINNERKKSGEKLRGGNAKVNIKVNKKLGCYLYLTKTHGYLLKKYLEEHPFIKISEEFSIKTSKLHLDEVAQGNTKIYFKDSTINSKDTTKQLDLLKKLVKQEYNLWLDKISNGFMNDFNKIIDFVMKIDVANSNAKCSIEYNYCKPIIVNNEKSFVKAIGLRHPIAERVHNDVVYVTNDIILGVQQEQNTNTQSDHIINGKLIYGINSIGKSTLMRAFGLNVVMSQAGLYVPCTSFEYYPYSTLFARISNTDNIYKKKSSFTNEISELDNIYNRINKNSLIIGDEIVNNTEYESGLNIVATTLILLSRSEATFIFATHMHEISKLSLIKRLPNIGIYHLDHYESKNGDLVFNRKLTPGNGDETYGLRVASSIIKNEEFQKVSLEVKKALSDEVTDILSTKTSNYNKDLYVHACLICNKKNTNKQYEGVLDTHHIHEQCKCTEDGFVLDRRQKKDDLSNLIPLCKSCHKGVHNNKLKVNGWIDTLRGRIVDFELL